MPRFRTGVTGAKTRQRPESGVEGLAFSGKVDAQRTSPNRTPGSSRPGVVSDREYFGTATCCPLSKGHQLLEQMSGPEDFAFLEPVPHELDPDGKPVGGGTGGHADATDPGEVRGRCIHVVQQHPDRVVNRGVELECGSGSCGRDNQIDAGESLLQVV